MSTQQLTETVERFPAVAQPTHDMNVAPSSSDSDVVHVCRNSFLLQLYSTAARLIFFILLFTLPATLPNVSFPLPFMLFLLSMSVLLPLAHCWTLARFRRASFVSLPYDLSYSGKSRLFLTPISLAFQESQALDAGCASFVPAESSLSFHRSCELYF